MTRIRLQASEALLEGAAAAWDRALSASELSGALRQPEAARPSRLDHSGLQPVPLAVARLADERLLLGLVADLAAYS
jgi:hypothetical protein